MGKMGLLHSGILNVVPGVDFVAACEPVNLTRRILKKALPKITIVESIANLSNFHLDALFITTPTRSHYAVAKEALELGVAKNLFIEKPLSNSYSQSEDLSRLIGSNVGMVGYVRRYMVTFMKAKELLDSGTIGQPNSFLLNMHSSDFYGIKGATAPIARGGVLKDLGCYAIDLILWYFGSCPVESAVAESLTGPGAVDKVAFSVFGNDVPDGKVSVSWCDEGYRMPEVEFLIYGSKGSIVANDDYVRIETKQETSTLYRLNLDDLTAFWLGSPEYYREDEQFIKGITENSSCEPSFHTAAQVERVIEDIERKVGLHE
jgi:predicted dehydrogenase